MNNQDFIGGGIDKNGKILKKSTKGSERYKKVVRGHESLSKTN